MPSIFSGFCFFFVKKNKNYKFSFESFSMNNCPNVSGKRAFESLELIFFENSKIIYPSSILFDFWRDWGRIEDEFRLDWALIWKNPFLYASSNVIEIERCWGRANKGFIFSKYSSRAFKRTNSEVIWTYSRWER